MTPKEILAAAKRRVPSLGIATVYRTIKAMVKDGAAVPVDLPNEPPRYEIAGAAHHHHFYCRRCGRLFPVECRPDTIGGMVPDGFAMEDHHITLYGLCSECAAGSI